MSLVISSLNLLVQRLAISNASVTIKYEPTDAMRAYVVR